MNVKDIIEGLDFRIDSLTKLLEFLENDPKYDHTAVITQDSARLDEVQSIRKWIKENSQE